MVNTNVKVPSEVAVARQGGAVLIVGLIMVLLMTIIGLAAVRGSNLQETMAGNMRERNVAFQVAEAGLRVGEERVEESALNASDFEGNIAGFYMDLGVPANNDFDAPLRQWDGDEWKARAIETDLELDDSVQERPLYLVERVVVLAQDAAEKEGSGIDLGSLDETGVEEDYYRVTARGESASGTSQAVVQSTYRAR